MITFKISAPGRIVLSGEYSIIHGKNVVMAGINRRTRLNFCELSDESRKIIIYFPNVNLLLRVPLEKIVSFFSSGNIEDMVSIPIMLFNYVKYLIVSNGMWNTFEQRFSLEIFFFLLYFVAYHEHLEMKSFLVHVYTELPIGAGFGSSSSFAICLAACFLHWARLQKGAHDAFNEEELMAILRYTMRCEEIMQDFTFPVDNIVCLFGQIGIFQYINPLSYHVKTINVARMKILLIDSQSVIRQHKSERVKQMVNLKHSYSNYADFVLNSSDLISTHIYNTLHEINNARRNTMLLRYQEHLYIILQLYILLSREIFRNFSISHPKFDTICSIAHDFGFVGKLTGDGFVYILLPPNITEEGITSFSTHLVAEGFKVTTTSIGCSGVRIDN